MAAPGRKRFCGESSGGASSPAPSSMFTKAEPLPVFGVVMLRIDVFIVQRGLFA